MSAATMESSRESRSSEVSLFRLYLLRAMYLLMVVGIANGFWPHVIHHTNAYVENNGALICLLSSIGVFAAIGIRYPLAMLPILLFEFFWKALWFVSMATPLWLAHQSYPGMSGDVFAVGLGVVLCPLVIPWPYVLAHYLAARGDRWH